MIESIIEHINSFASEIVEKNYGLCEVVETDKESFPAFYNGNEFIYVTNFDDFYGGLSYLRKNGKVKHSYPESTVSNDLQVLLNIPLIIVLFIKKATMEKNDAYSSDRAALKLISLISSKDSELRKTLTAKKVTVLTTDHDTDSNSVLSAEYKGEPKGIDPKFAYLSVSFEVEVLISKKCMDECCL